MPEIAEDNQTHNSTYVHNSRVVIQCRSMHQQEACLHILGCSSIYVQSKLTSNDSFSFLNLAIVFPRFSTSSFSWATRADSSAAGGDCTSTHRCKPHGRHKDWAYCERYVPCFARWLSVGVYAPSSRLLPPPPPLDQRSACPQVAPVCVSAAM